MFSVTQFGIQKKKKKTKILNYLLLTATYYHSDNRTYTFV